MKRRHPTREPKQRILVVCEGEKTEPCYLKDFQHHERNPLVHIEVADAHGVPLTVVEKAIELRRNAEAEAKAQHDVNLQFDSVWGIFDVDDHPRVQEAKQMAKAAGIELAISNPCFELWALLHFQDQHAHVERDKVASVLKAHIPGYGKVLDFELMKDRYQEALRRARELDAEAIRYSEPGRNPTTGMPRLTEMIRRK